MRRRAVGNRSRSSLLPAACPQLRTEDTALRQQTGRSLGTPCVELANVARQNVPLRTIPAKCVTRGGVKLGRRNVRESGLLQPKRLTASPGADFNGRKLDRRFPSSFHGSVERIVRRAACFQARLHKSKRERPRARLVRRRATPPGAPRLIAAGLPTLHGGHGTDPYEQNTQPEPSLGRSSIPQDRQRCRTRHASFGIVSASSWPHEGQRSEDSRITAGMF
jgi:hypothetical protein